MGVPKKREGREEQRPSLEENGSARVPAEQSERPIEIGRGEFPGDLPAVPLPPEFREWALRQATEEEILAGLKEVEETGGTELGETIRRLKQKRRARERTEPQP